MVVAGSPIPLVSKMTASGRFASEWIRIGGNAECESLRGLGNGAGNPQSAAKSSKSNALPAERK